MIGSFRLQKSLVLPLVLLAVVLLEEIAAYKLRQHVRDIRLRTGLLVALYGVGFAFAAAKVGPWVKKLLTRVRKTSQRQAGAAGVWLFYAASYGAVYYAFYLLETRGAASLLPAPLR